MTSAEAHPSPDVLAELAEGSLDEALTGASESHVDQCTTCQGVMEQLRGVSAALRQLPAEVTVPELVRERLSAALTAEAAGGGAEAARARAEPVAATSDTGPVAWFRRRVPQALALAATVAVVGLAGYVVTMDNGRPDASSAGSGEEAADNAEARPDSEALAQDEESSVSDPQPARGAVPATAELEAQVEQVWEQPTELAADCGEALGDELGMDVVGSVESGSGVLIVLSGQEDGGLRGELVPTCGSTTAESLTSPVFVDVQR